MVLYSVIDIKHQKLQTKWSLDRVSIDDITKEIYKSDYTGKTLEFIGIPEG